MRCRNLYCYPRGDPRTRMAGLSADRTANGRLPRLRRIRGPAPLPGMGSTLFAELSHWERLACSARIFASFTVAG